ncbi:MAG: hypothetical protein ACSHXA_04740 [Polaribacter sp.]|uniref:hypothetical protein n=1 Tax=Polaribacter sp. TaxID=1920175 RepID=UPI003EFAA02F
MTDIKIKLEKLNKELKKVGYFLILVPFIEFILKTLGFRTPFNVLVDEYGTNALGYFGAFYALGGFLLYCHTKISRIIEEMNKNQKNVNKIRGLKSNTEIIDKLSNLK